MILKVGDKIKHNYGEEYTVQIVGHDSVAITNRYDDAFIVDEARLDKYYTKVETFYKVGKTYRFSNGRRTDTWKIQSVHELARPQIGESKWKAVAVMTTVSGYEDLQTLSKADFNRMEEV